MRIFLTLIMLLGITALLQAQEDQGYRFSLDEAIAYALENNYQP